MDINKAKRIQTLRTGSRVHSWRRISELICQEYPEEDQSLSGNQFHGVDLCLDAMRTIAQVSYISEIPKIMREEWDT